MCDRPEDKPQTDDAAWEDLCHQCGECCFEKTINSRGKILTTAIPCRFLDIHTRRCRIYPDRFKHEEDCIKLTPENVGELDWLPEDCAYRNFPDE